MLDITKLLFSSNNNAFKNNNVYTGSFVISGTTAAGTNTKTFTTTLLETPDMLDIIFNGPTDTVYGSDPRPAGGWFRQGSIWVLTDNVGGGSPGPWRLQAAISGATLTITAQLVQGFTAAETLTATTFSYRIVDYSIY